jgi:two-component system KDP operon response regulator KdpE
MNRKRILIVEDDAAVRQVLLLRLKAQNYDSIAFGDSIGALSEARRQPPDLIILDLGLPGGGGISFMERLQALPHLSGTPVIVVSAQERSTSEQQALDAGASAYFQKPADPEALLMKIRELLGEP